MSTSTGQRPQNRPQNRSQSGSQSRPQNRRPVGGAASRKRPNKKARVDRTLKLVGYIFCGLMFLVGLITLYFVMRLKMVPGKYVLAAAIGLLAVTVLFIALQHWRMSGIVTKALSLILIVVMLLGCAYLRYTRSKVDDMTGVATQVDNIQVYVLKDDPAQNVVDAKDYNFGILTTLDRENTNQVVADIIGEVGSSITTTEKEDVFSLVDSLYNGEVKVIILNSAYEGYFASAEGYEDFPDRVRSIAIHDIKKEVEETTENEEYLKSNDNVFTIYISGVDSRSSVNANSNSDVNILMTVNKDTHQILLITTPRDFYVPLSISNGAKDKLTHAGGHGIDVSKDTLAMLYEVNVDDYLRINFAGFEKIVNSLGGITVWSDYAFYEETEESGSVTVQQGWNTFDGRQALVFARTRHAFADGDRQRGKNQLLVIEAIMDKALSPDVLKNYTTLLDAISDCMVTSMSYDEIADLVREQLNNGGGWDIQKYSVNGFDSSNTTWSTGGQYLYVMEPDYDTVNQAKEYLQKMYNGEVIDIPEE